MERSRWSEGRTGTGLTPRLSPAAIRRLCLRVDTEAYSGRTPQAQVAVQSRLRALTDVSCRWAGVDVARCELQPSGDGVLVVFPAGLDEGRAVPRLLEGLADGLRRGNALDWPGDRMRLRAALGQGTVRVAENGYVGAVVVAVSRLVDSPPLRAALAARPDRDLAVALTDDLYHDLRYEVPARAEPYRRVRVSIPGKAFEADAWISVPHPGSLLRRPSTGTAAGATGADVLAGALGLGGLALPFAEAFADGGADDPGGHYAGVPDLDLNDPASTDTDTDAGTNSDIGADSGVTDHEVTGFGDLGHGDPG